MADGVEGLEGGGVEEVLGEGADGGAERVDGGRGGGGGAAAAARRRLACAGPSVVEMRLS